MVVYIGHTNTGIRSKALSIKRSLFATIVRKPGYTLNAWIPSKIENQEHVNTDQFAHGFRVRSSKHRSEFARTR